MIKTLTLIDAICAIALFVTAFMGLHAKMLKAVPRTAEDKEAEVEAEKEEAEKEAKKTTGKKATRARRSSKVRIEKPADKN